MRNVSIYKGYSNRNPKDISLSEIVNIIRSDESVRDNTLKYRSFLQMGMKADADKEKTKANTFTVAVRCEGGKRLNNVVEFTGLAFGDFDNLPQDKLPEALMKLKNDPHTVLTFITHSQRGLRIVYSYQKGEVFEQLDLNQKAGYYKSIFFLGMEYYEKLLGLPSDQKCNDCTRVSNIVHDPNVYYNPQAEPFILDINDFLSSLKKPKKIRRVSLEPAVLAAQAELKEQGYVFEPGHHNDYVSRMGYLLNAFGVDYDEACDWAIGEFSQDYNDDIIAIMESCYRHTEEHGTRKLPKAKSDKHQWATIEEIETFFNSQMELRYNVVLRQCEIRWLDQPDQPFSRKVDRDESTLWCRIRKAGMDVQSQDWQHVWKSEFIRPYNPFEDYFNSLPPWDGITDYIGELARTVHIKGDQETFVEKFRKWLVGMVVTLFDEQVVNHEIMVFIGRQGNFKSTFFSLLLPPELQPYFQVKINSNNQNKDDMLTMCEKALICLEEIDALRPKELNQLKAMVTAKVVCERAAYARNKEERPHIASFCATGNNPHFLTDPTDHRRWLVVEVEDIDNPYENPFNYTGIYSQAYALWKNGYRYWLNQSEIRDLNQENRNFECPSPEEELVLTYFRPSFYGSNSIFMKVSEVLERINVNVKQPLSPIKLGIVMKRLGFIQMKHNRERGFVVIERNPDEIHSTRKLIAKEVQKD